MEATDARLRTGWLGRYLDRAGTSDNPLQGLSLDYQLAPVLATTRVPVAAVAGPDAYRFWSPNVWGQVEARMLEAMASFGRHASSRDPALADAGRIAAQSERLRGQLAPFAEKGALTVPPGYPSSRSGFPKQLAGLAAMLGAGFRCAASRSPARASTTPTPTSPTRSRRGSRSRRRACSHSSATSMRAARPIGC